MHLLTSPDTGHLLFAVAICIYASARKTHCVMLITLCILYQILPDGLVISRVPYCTSTGAM